MDNLIEISQYNYERFESLITKHQCSREAPPVDDSATAGSSRAPAAVERVCSSHAAVNANGQNIIMYSDGLGKSMGLQLDRRLAGQNILNICTPGASYNTKKVRLFVAISRSTHENSKGTISERDKKWQPCKEPIERNSNGGKVIKMQEAGNEYNSAIRGRRSRGRPRRPKARLKAPAERRVHRYRRKKLRSERGN
ncbi:hypothetical protein EVAR_36863_1 [Eumeta japonica]|uniref:Uncharacterized protein n=1 Tax=Eumeta variegata TaxID=151549 RepID=A0A4C1WT02_EUMVA|nr:hypothetical protein EVAR_36863_1 [Eumeta japonica]